MNSMMSEELLEKAKKNSIVNTKDTFIKGVRNISKKTLVLLVTIIMALSLCSCGISVENGEVDINMSQEYIDYREGINHAGFITDDVRQTLKDYGIEYYDPETGIIENDVSVYKNIENLSEDDLIGYYGILGKEECEKVLQALGYTGWDDFLTEKGCFDKNGNPSIPVWERSVYIEIGRQVSNEGEKSK